MKKAAVLFLTLVMVVSMSLTAFAATGAFVSSPSTNPAPELISYSTDDPECTAELEIIPYSERDTLDEEDREKLEEAYEQISELLPNSEFYKALEDLAEQTGKKVSELSVSDLFEISYWSCPDHEGHEGYTITLKAETFDRLVGIMVFDGEKWVLADILEWNADELTVTFWTKDIGAVAVIVDNGSGDNTSTPQTGDNTMVYAGVMAAAAAGLALVLVSLKKRKA